MVQFWILNVALAFSCFMLGRKYEEDGTIFKIFDKDDDESNIEDQ